MYTTYKYNRNNEHNLDDFDSLDAAIKSAKALHNPAWPSSQGIIVVDDNNNTVFDSGKD